MAETTTRTDGLDSAFAPPGADVGGHAPRHIVATVKARDLDEVRHMVGEAVRTQRPLSILSTGMNWGLGSRWPVTDGCTVLDLSEMNRIRSLDLNRGIAVIEPGVTQHQLAARLDGTSWILNVTSSCAHSSVIGNALDRGDGTIRPRSQDILGVEAVLVDGTVLTTGGLTPDRGYLGPLVGPDLTGLFVQSNLAVVTAMAISLVRRTESVHLVHARLPRASATAALDVLANLYRDYTTCLGTPRLRDLYLVTSEQDSVRRSDACTVLIPVRGAMGLVEHITQTFRDELTTLDRNAHVRCVDAKVLAETDVLYPRALLAQGTPTCAVVQEASGSKSCSVDTVARTGLLIFLPLAALDGHSPNRTLGILEKLTRDYTDLVTVEISVATTHTAHLVVQIHFDRNSDHYTRRAHALRDEMWRALNATVYRTNISHAPFELFANRRSRLPNAIKYLMDRNNIIAPGRILMPEPSMS